MNKKNIWLFLFVLVLFIVFPIQATAATVLNDPAENLSASIDGSSHSLGAAYSGSASTGNASMKVGALRSAMNGTLTLTNKGTEAALLSFSYSLSGTYSTCTIAGGAVTGSGTYKTELSPNESVAIYLAVAGWKEATVTLSNVTLNVTSAANVTLSHNGLGSISVGGTTVSSGATVEVAAEGTTLVATPSSGATFLGWINTVDNSVYSTSASLSYIPTGDISLKAIFAHADHEATFWGSSKSYLFDSLNDAITHATGASNKTIVLAANGTLPAGSYSIPSGVTLLIPFDSDGTCYTTAPGYVSDSWSKPSAYRTLTVAEGANVSVNGNISVSAKVSAKMGYAGAPTSSYGHISMNSGSSITVNSGGNLYAWGYISGSGNVTIESGASVYESFQVVDWRGGTASSGMLNNSQKVFPLTQYYIQNVEAPMTLKSGASEKCSMVADIISVRQVTVSYLGTSGCMFNLTNGSVTKRYDGSKDRLILDINGDLSVSKTTIDLILSYSINTEKYVLPFNSNIDVNVNSGGTIAFAQTASLLPGVQINIAEGATAKLNSGAKLFVYDESEWKANYFVYSNAYFRPIRYAHSQKYTRSNNADIIDAVIKVNGTLDASAGYLYTTDGGANICSTGTGVVKLQTPETSPTLYEATQSGTSISYVSIPVTAAQLKHADGSYLSSGANEYTYDLNAGKWRCANHTYPENSHVCSVCGYDAGHTEETISGKAATCTENGLTDGKKCTVCGEITVEQEIIETLGHTYDIVVTAPTCTEEGYTTYSCTVCSDTQVTDKVAASGHSMEWSVVTLPTCETDGSQHGKCKVCGHEEDKVEAATGHDMQETTAAVAPTCTETGKTAVLTCANNCGKTEGGEEVAATGHTVVTDAAVAPTCTATGKTEGSHCSVCNEVLVAQTVVDKLGHSYNDGEVTTPATCTEKGVKTYTCGTCGDKYTEEIAATGHSYTSVVTAPTCEAEGYTTHTCACGDSKVDTYVDALGHDYELIDSKSATCTEDGFETYACKNDASHTYTKTLTKTGHDYKSEVTAPTCTEKGYTTHTCACGDKYVDTYVDALGHSYNAEVTTEATCTEKGVKTCTCGTCGASYTEEIAATGHSYTSEVTAPTCEAKGYTTYTCSACGDTYKADEVAALGHNMQETSKEVPATCTTDGKTAVYTCEHECGKTTGGEVLPATGHNMQKSADAVAPSCTVAGKTETKTCANGCGLTEGGIEVPALGHKYDAVVTAPTCTEAGYTTYTCSVCGDTYTADDVAETGHTEVIDAAKAPSCTETGLTEGSHCSVCGEVIVAQTVVDALGHKHEAVVTAPTCTTGGFTTYTCQCGDSYIADEVDALGHSYETVVTAPTCTEAGYTTYTCSVCGDTYTGDKVNATGHDYDAVVTVPTCTEAGYTTYTCRCGESYVADEVAAKGHSYDDGVVTTDPTCTTEGVKTFTCGTCGDTKTEPVDKLGHDEVDHEAKAPTCTEIGWDAYVTCSRCDYTTRGADIPATGHKDDIADHICDNDGCGVIVSTCGEKDVEYGGGSVKIDREMLGDLKLSTFVQKMGVQVMMNKVDFCAGSVSGLESLFTNSDFLRYLSEELHIAEVPAEDEAKTNAAVLYVAYLAGQQNEDELRAFLSSGNVKSTAAANMQTEDTYGLGLMQRALAYGMYNAYAYDSGDDELINRTSGIYETLNHVDDQAVRDYISGEQGQKDLKAMLSALSLEESAREDSNVVNTLLANGFNDPDLVEVIERELGTYSHTCPICNNVSNCVWKEATCTTPKTCLLCGKTEGDVSDEHTFVDGTCTVCGEKQGYEVTIDNRTLKGDHKATTNIDVAKTYLPGEKFTVTCDLACVVAISVDSGTTYEELSCVAKGGNTYEFTIPSTVDRAFEIGIALRGDANSSGSINVQDCLRISRYRMEKANLDALEYIAANANSTANGAVNAQDCLRISRWRMEEAEITWKLQ